MAASLSSHDVARLMSEPSPDVRAELAGKIGADLSRHALTPTEVKLGQDIVRILARDIEERVRAVAVSRLATLAEPAQGRRKKTGGGR